MAQQKCVSISRVKIWTWFLSVGKAEGGGDPGDGVEGDGEESGDSKLTKHAADHQ